MRKKRLLVFANGNYIFGAERVTIDILEDLKKKDYTVHCIVSGWNDGNFIRYLEEIGIEYSTMKLGWYYLTQIKWSLDSLVHLPGAVLKFLRIKKQFVHDYIYVISFRQIALLYPFLKKNIVYHVHDNNGVKKQSRFFLKMVDKKVIKYIAVSHYIKHDLVNCGINAEKIEVIYNGIKMQPLFERTAESKFTIGIVGQILPTKGHDMVIEAFRILRERGCDVQLFIVGKGNEKFTNELKEKIEQYHMESLVFWKGFKNAPSEIYKGIDVIVAPSTLSEAFGLMACEANMFTIPALVTNTGGQPEIIEDGFNGYVVDPLDPVDIADKLIILYNNPELVKKMGENGRTRVTVKFSIAEMNCLFQKLIHNLP